MLNNIFLAIFSHKSMIIDILISLVSSFYFILNLQWYNYKLYRMFTKHHKRYFHLIFLLIPQILIHYLNSKLIKIDNSLALFIMLVIYVALLSFWYHKVDKKLVYTSRVKYFFIGMVIVSVGSNYFFHFRAIFVLLIVAFIINIILMKIISIYYTKKAKNKLNRLKNLTIIGITASYGKTSIKNFLYEVLEHKYKVHKTPRSVNTLMGVVKDINENLTDDTEIYIVEMGARTRDDIKVLTQFVNQHYSILGEIGMQHIEYFKTLDNIKYAKSQVLHSKRLKRAFVHVSNTEVATNEKYILYGSNKEIIKSDLSGNSFSITLDGVTHTFTTNVLGRFQPTNIIPVILVARELGLNINDIKHYVADLHQVEHRLQKIVTESKIILDDSFNGNLNGMLEAIRLVQSYEGRSVIVTPGLVEATKSLNLRLAKSINSVFDLVIITGSLNREILDKNITKPKKIILTDKTELEKTLAEHTKADDLILFANDAPNFI